MNYIAEMTWTTFFKDVLDIGIVSYIIYKLFVIVRGTRTVQLIAGIFFLVATWIVSIWLNLYTLQWLMNQIFTFGVVTILIIFQPELRKALEKLGGGVLFRNASFDVEMETEERVRVINKAVQHLSTRRIGALLVFERQTGLKDYIDEGTRLDSRLSSELLVNLFVPNTPLHDGATIIRENTIVASACVLPLTTNPSTSRNLGTRHRAGIGITEISDALSVIVSEETGQVSLAVEGLIYRDVTYEWLFQKMLEELSPSYRKNSIRSKAPLWSLRRWRK